jgi:hypothetical protein
MKTSFAVILLVSVIALSSFAQDTNVAPTNSLEIVLNCTTDNSRASRAFVFHSATNITLDVCFRNVGEKNIPAGDTHPTVVWDGKEYKQWSYEKGHMPIFIGPPDWPPTSIWSFTVKLSDYVIPPDAQKAGRHTIAVKSDQFESNKLTVITLM